MKNLSLLSTTCLLLACGGAAHADSPAVLLHHFDFSQGATSIVGEHRSGTLLGGARVADGVLTLAADGDHVSFAGALVPLADDGYNTSWTVSAWVRQTATISTPFATFFSAAGDTGYHPGMQMSMLAMGGGASAGFAYTGVNSGMSLQSYRPVGSDWHHFAAVFNANRGTLYMDGQYMTGLDWGDRGFNPNNILNNSVTYLGRSAPALYLATTQQFIGQLDDVRIYAGGLTEVQVGQQFAAGPSPLSPVPEPGSAGLAALGLLGLAGWLGRGRRHRAG